MDTRLRKFKYSIFTKFLCWLIAMCAFVCCFSVALKVMLGCIVMGPGNYFKDTKVSFFETDGFLNHLQQDFFACGHLSQNNAVKLEAGLNAQKEAVTAKALNSFLDYKADIIKSELEYAVQNWDENYYIYDDSVDVTVPEDYTQVYVDVDEPKSIQAAKKILVNAEGREFLLYEELVRSDAFSASVPSADVLVVQLESGMCEFEFHIDIPLEYNEAQVTKYISDSYDNFVNESIEGSFAVPLEFLQRLEYRENLKYYVVDFGGEIYSNIDSIPQNLKNNERYILANGENYEVKGFAISNIAEYLQHNGSKINVLCMYFDETFSGDDLYSRMYNTYKLTQQETVTKTIAIFAFLLVLSVVMLVIWLKLVGKRADNDNTKLLFIDKIPTDLHIVAVGLLGFALLVCLHDILNFGTEYFDSLMFTKDFNTIFIASISLLLMLFTEWISSVVRIKKAGKSFFKQTLIFMAISLIVKGIVAILKKVKKLFQYRPKAFKWQFVAGLVAFFAINAFISLFIVFAEMFTGFDGVFMVICGAVLIIFDSFICFFSVRYINSLDKIIVASAEHKKVDFGTEKVPSSLRVLADNLDKYNDALEDAVAEAVKNEQMKTQLITNVSHDLKTPLTSLINYSDLLSKCDITDEKALEYIGVINSQSIKLKRLIEDLIEASKVSTGNVQLNKTKINLAELSVQALVEFSAEFENNRVEVKFSEPEEAPVVYADSIKTYRIISNLFSNAKKYSAPNTRVYISVYDDGGFGCFEMKNISKEPLNISPEALTERFVRGEESRTNEGNGLGLSIAKDLCKLQGGELLITIDGDLFKVTVKLPKE